MTTHLFQWKKMIPSCEKLINKMILCFKLYVVSDFIDINTCLKFEIRKEDALKLKDDFIKMIERES